MYMYFQSQNPDSGSNFPTCTQFLEMRLKEESMKAQELWDKLKVIVIYLSLIKIDLDL